MRHKTLTWLAEYEACDSSPKNAFDLSGCQTTSLGKVSEGYFPLQGHVVGDVESLDCYDDEDFGDLVFIMSEWNNA